MNLIEFSKYLTEKLRHKNERVDLYDELYEKSKFKSKKGIFITLETFF